MPNNYRKKLTYNTTLRLPEETRDIILAMATQESRSEASMVRVLLEEAIRHRRSSGHVVRHVDLSVPASSLPI